MCFVSQTTSPGPEQHDFRWELISQTGVPLFDQVYYNGEWRRYPSVPIGAEVYYSGDPSLYFNPVTLYGTHGGQWDGWQIDISNAAHFPIIASTFSSAGLGWIINYQGVDTNVGGVTQIVLDQTTTYRPASNGLTLYGWEADGDHPGGAARLLGLFNTGAPSNILIPPDPGNPTPSPIPIFPSFVAKALVVYRGLEGS